MVKEKLIIRNFAGFEHIEFDFKPINIFIGPQAAGKSVVIKLAYYFKDFISNVKTWSSALDKYDEFQTYRFLGFFPKATWGAMFFILHIFLMDIKYL